MQKIILGTVKQKPQAHRWKMVLLGDVFDFTKKPKELRYSSYEYIPFVPMESIPIGYMFFDQFELRANTNISSGTYFEPGDILLSKITPSFENGKQGIIKNLPVPFGIATTEVIPIRDIEGMSDKHFLFYYLMKHDVRSLLTSKMEGSTGRQRLSAMALANLEINLPPLPEQRTIAYILQTVQQAIQTRRKELELERERKATLMERLFTHGTRGEKTKQSEVGEIPESWEVKKLGEIANIASGGTPDRTKPEYWNGNIPWAKTGEINYTTISATEEKITQLGLKNSSARIIPAGTLIMAMYGQGVTRGRVAILGIDAAINQACAAIYIENIIYTKFLFYFLSFKYELIRELGHGANQKNLNALLIKSIVVPKPSKNVQEEIITCLSACDTKIAALEKEITLHEELFRALLDELMTGRISTLPLVEQLEKGSSHDGSRTGDGTSTTD